MNINRNINPLFDALVYLSNKVNGYSMTVCRDMLYKRYPYNVAETNKLMNPYFELERYIDERLHVENSFLEKFFRCAEPAAMSYTPYGNIAGMVFGYIAAHEYTPTMEQAAASARAMTDVERMASVLSYSGRHMEYRPDPSNMENFYRYLCKLNIDEASKWRMLDCYYNFTAFIDELYPIIDSVIVALTEWSYPEIDTLADYGNVAERLINEQLESMSIINGRIDAFNIFPSLTMTNNWFTEVKYEGDEQEYCSITVHFGLLRYEVDGFKRSQSSPGLIVSALKALGDTSRYNILSCLMERPMFGRELSETLKLAPNTVSQHISRLVAEELVTCRFESTYTYYAVNSFKISEIADELKHQFCPKGALSQQIQF